MENAEKSVFKDAQFLLGLFAGIAVISFVGMVILGYQQVTDFHLQQPPLVA